MRSPRIPTLALVIALLSWLPVTAQVLFQDDFESGMGQWTTVPNKTPMEWSSARNVIPAEGMYSAFANSSSDYIYHFMEQTTKTTFRVSWWIYDDGNTNLRAYGEARAFGGNDYTPSGALQVYAAGKYQAFTGVNVTKYQGRVAYPSSINWFNLDAPGSPNRSVGWHKFTIETGASGSVRFYVDGKLSKSISGANPYGVNCVLLGAGASADNTVAYYDGVMVEDGRNLLSLQVTPESLYIRPGEPVQVLMRVSELAQKVNGCQAMLGYSSTYLYAASSCVAPGGGPWDQLIYNSWDVGSGVPGEIDTAIGVNAQGSVGTQESGTIAIITLTSTGVEGTTTIVFRPDEFPDPYLVRSTFLSDMSGKPVWPFKSDSQEIVIDGTPASLNIASATQNSVELLTSLGSTVPAVQGRVDVRVDASDAYGLPAAPAVNVYDANLVQIPAVFDGQIPYGSGHYYYHFVVPPTAANGQALIRAAVFDKAGNRTDDVDHFMINKNQVTGTVTLQGYVGGTRDVTFSINGGSLITKSLSFSGDTASYILTNLPDTVTSLSAKAAWNLRKRASDPVNLLDSNGQAAINFLLPAGDINGTNSVNILDYSIMKASWLGSNPVADIDGNGIVNIGDYDLMKLNWFKLGDPL